MTPNQKKKFTIPNPVMGKGIFAYMPYDALDVDNNGQFKIEFSNNIDECNLRMREYYPTGYYVTDCLLCDSWSKDTFFDLLRQNVIPKQLLNNKEPFWVFCTPDTMHSIFNKLSDKLHVQNVLHKQLKYELTGRNNDNFALSKIAIKEIPEYVGHVVFHTGRILPGPEPADDNFGQVDPPPQPMLQPEPEPEPETEPEPEPQPEPEPEPQLRPRLRPRPLPQPQPIYQPQPLPPPRLKSKSKSKSKSQSQSKSKSQPRTQSKSRSNAQSPPRRVQPLRDKSKKKRTPSSNQSSSSASGTKRKQGNGKGKGKGKGK